MFLPSQLYLGVGAGGGVVGAAGELSAAAPGKTSARKHKDSRIRSGITVRSTQIWQIMIRLGQIKGKSSPEKQTMKGNEKVVGIL